MAGDDRGVVSVSEERVREVSAVAGLLPAKLALALTLLGIQVPSALMTQTETSVLETPDGSVGDSSSRPGSPTEGLTLVLDTSDRPDPEPPTKKRKIAKVADDDLKTKLNDPGLFEAVNEKISADFSEMPRHRPNESYTFVLRYLIAIFHCQFGIPLIKLVEISLLTIMSGRVVDGGYHIDYAGGFTIPNALYEVVKKFARQRLDRTQDSHFFLAWSGRAVACSHTEVKRFRCQLEAFYKGRNNAEPIDRKEANYRRVINRYPVAVGISCPNKAQLEVLGLTDTNEIRRLQQRWRHAQGKIESMDWLDTFKKTAPTIQQVEDKLKSKSSWRMTAKTLLSLWSPRSSRTNCDQSDNQANFDECLETGKWPH